MNGSIQIKRDKYYAVVRFSDKAILHGALAEAYKKDMIAANPAPTYAPKCQSRVL